ncbi:MAG: TetR/AcrR family transcriptional regulator [Bacteroidales bacterium]|jgi:AcrR family transcriptional regulator|nr:TetR/AcrR family transcriptional regulator [Bacteroidales bacterium]
MEVNKKQIDILNATKDLFYKYEFRKVTVEDICRAANVSKMTFYKFFSNKLEAAKSMLDLLFGEAMDKFDAMMGSNIPFAEKMKQIVVMKVERSKNSEMVIIQNLYTDTDPEIAQYIQGWIHKGLNFTKKHFLEAQQKGEMRNDISVELIMLAIDKMQEIAKDKRIFQIYDNTRDFTTEITKLFLYGITNDEEKY